MNYVGIDHHRQSSHMTLMDQEGQVLRLHHIIIESISCSRDVRIPPLGDESPLLTMLILHRRPFSDVNGPCGRYPYNPMGENLFAPAEILTDSCFPP